MGAAAGWDTVAEVDLAGLRIAYRTAGAGPPVLLLHGAFADGRAWRRQVEDLGREYTLVAWDAPGCGRSDDPPETVGEREYVGYLAGFMDALGLEPVHVVGHSFGGMLALALVRVRPSAVRSLVLVSTYAGWAGSLPRSVVEERIRQARRDAELPADELVRRFLPELFPRSAAPDTVAEAAAIMREFHPAGVRALANAFGRADLRDVLPRIDVPTLVLSGACDRRSPPAVARDLQAAIPGAVLELVPESGHESALQAPEAFNAAVLGFLRTVPA